MCKEYRRKKENLYTHSFYIAEFWNTVSNLPFIIIGILRLCELDDSYFELEYMYALMILAGFASGIHHGLNDQNCLSQKYTIIVDWIPILLSILVFNHYGLMEFVSLASWVKIILAFSVLITGHVYTLIPVPWGHVMWHLLACLAIDSTYQDVRINIEF